MKNQSICINEAYKWLELIVTFFEFARIFRYSNKFGKIKC